MIESQALLLNTSKLLRTKCVDGITVNEKKLEHYMETTVGIVTALNPIVGYEKGRRIGTGSLRQAEKAVLKSFGCSTFLPTLQNKSCLIRPSSPT